MAFKAITKGKEGDRIKVTSHIEGFWGNDKICAYGLKGTIRFLCTRALPQKKCYRTGSLPHLKCYPRPSV